MPAGPANRYRHPFPGPLGRLVTRLANSFRFADIRQAVMSRLPFLTLESDVRDVVYLTWMVDVAAAQALAPQGLRLWQRDGKTPFTVLTYRHGHFGPAFLGPLRHWLPSPMQSNWRLYAEEENRIFFLKNIMDSFPHALGTRLFSDALQTHYAAGFTHQADGDALNTEISSGEGSAPALNSKVRPTVLKNAPPQFSSWDEAVKFLACQDTALAYVERKQCLAISEISLPIDLLQIQPLQADGDVNCALLPQLRATTGAPFCFLVPKVKFRVLSERLL